MSKKTKIISARVSETTYDDVHKIMHKIERSLSYIVNKSLIKEIELHKNDNILDRCKTIKSVEIIKGGIKL